MRVPAVLIVVAVLLPAAHAAALRPFTELHAAAVRLSDLFDGLGGIADPVLGPAPVPGGRIVVEAPQLAAIARDFGVDWRPASGAERAVLEREGEAIQLRAVLSAAREALAQAGAPADADVALTNFDPPVVADAAAARVEVAGLGYDAASGRFTAALTVAEPGAPRQHLRISGQALCMVEAATLVRPVALGSVLAAGDLAPVRVRATALAGHAPLPLEQVAGNVLRRLRPPGAALLQGDVAAPVLVARGGTVRLLLDAGSILLSAQGVALDAGGAGDRIRAQNPSSHAIVQAVVSGAGEARVLPGTAAAGINLASVP